jgi:peptidoglycan/LPS O-acetylase OafA/YrhL
MSRRHDIDALRAIAFALLILYHWCMLYVFDWGWHIKSSYQAEWLQWPMLFMNRWRMDLIFLISGMAAAFLLKPDHVLKFVRLRNWRLMLPLVFGIVVVVPIQPYVQGVSNGLVEPGFGQFLVDYFTGKHWPKDAFSGWQHPFTWNHLWYLAYLWIYTLVLALIAKPLNSKLGLAIRSKILSLRGAALMVVPALPLLLYTLTLQARFPDTGDFYHDWYRNPMYFTVFLYGYLIARDDGFWKEALRLRRTSLIAALGLAAAYLGLVAILPDDISFAMQAFVWTLRNLYVWIMLLAILGWSHAYLNRPFRWLSWANEAVYPWYMLHQSLIVLFAYWLVSLKLGPALESSLVLIGTVAGCWLLFAIIRRVPWLRPLFGMKPMSKPVTQSIDQPSAAAYS